MNGNPTRLYSHKSLFQFLCDILAEGILINDVHQMQEFENEPISWRFHIRISPTLSFCVHLPAEPQS